MYIYGYSESEIIFVIPPRRTEMFTQMRSVTFIMLKTKYIIGYISTGSW